ncbi:phosphoribosylanthranilate isomerase [Chlorobium ferrooxidans]|uniref:N-(5'-phosphoribosyl)anthranilate isomerase n=1 Tax=Chlorobium ferrooxidans DSM 13031 TaxID=377431 RepID=Q0YP33_9CHLB|nr:phosphoribosylanthranilate isomerase [Chlorobium ferrooxidans]EAT58054.1 Phosphoribosylanthranilate isomerase [Chlorobium ferrooxidans DSM 13031]
MVKIKICGITRLSDALDASLAGADCLGFNFSRRSPRVISPENARAIIAQLPPFVQSAGIFVDQSPEEINEICRFCDLQIAQLHSEQYTPANAQSIHEARVIRVFRPEEDFDVEWVRSYARQSGTNTFLFDAYRPDMEGGTGETIGTALASRIFSELGSSCYTILAGGLNETNVADAIRLVQPWAVDTASGVECEPGIKDPEKIKAFIRAVRLTSIL